jgi:hypothetical protein
MYPEIAPEPIASAASVPERSEPAATATGSAASKVAASVNHSPARSAERQSSNWIR